MSPLEENLANYQLIAVMILKYANGELLVAVVHNQLRTMALETVDPMDLSHPHPNGQYPLSASCTV